MTKLPVIAACLAAVLVLAGCTEPRPFPTPTPTPTESIGPTGDGVLRIGALLSMDGDVSGIGPGMVAAIETAVRDANAAGGVLGVPVETIYRNAGGVDDERLETGFADLVERGVDVIIGPSSPALLERLLPLADAAGIAVIATSAPSPTVSSAEPAGSLLRTVPAVDREVVAVMQALVDEKVGSIAIVAGSDAQGNAVVDFARAALAETSTTMTTVERADAATNIRRLSFSLAASAPDAVVIATTGVEATQLAQLITALLERGVRGDQFWFTSGALADYSSSLAPGAIEGASGVRSGAQVDEQFAARLRQSDPRLRTEQFAPETYDAVVLAVLAATIAGDDGGTSVARAFGEALRGSVACVSVGQCLDALGNGQSIDYDGLSGPLGLDDAGDVATAELSVVVYDAENRPQPARSVSLAD